MNRDKTEALQIVPVCSGYDWQKKIIIPMDMCCGIDRRTRLIS
jgi:hypothetical protein